MRRTVLILALCAVGSVAFARPTLDYYGRGPGGWGGGGVFYMEWLADPVGNYAIGDTLETFCVEVNENLQDDPFYAVVNTAAIAGGKSGGNPDPLDARSAYLYNKWLDQGWGVPVDEADLNNDLQRAIWYMEGEITSLADDRRGVTRPVWEPSEADKALHAHARGLAADLGFEIPAQMAGGGSDGNFTGAMGIPTLDSLGPRGKGLHTLTEHIFLDSLPERGRLMAGLLATLS